MPNFGYETIGSTLSAITVDDHATFYLGQVADAGTINSLSLYNTVTGTTFKLALYTGTASAPDTLVATTSDMTSNGGWATGAASGSFAANSHLWLSVKANGSTNMWRITAAGYPFNALTGVPYANAFPNPYGSFTSAGGRRFSGYVTYTIPITLTITSPVTRRCFQRVGSTRDIPITGTAGSFTGALEARFNGGAWQTVATITADGTWSGTLTGQALGAGTLEVRRVAPNTDALVSVADILLGRLYLVAGDSISEGRLDNAQSRGSAPATVYRQLDDWAFANDPIDNGHSGTLNGSHWPLLAQMLTQHLSVPIGFVSVGRGSRDVAGSTAAHIYFKKGEQGYIEIGAQVAEAGGSLEAALIHLGPNAATASPALTQQQYRDAITQWTVDLRTDVQAGLPIYLGIHGRNTASASGNPPIRRALAQVAAEGATLDGPNLMGPNWSDGIHPKTDADAALTAGRWFAALTGVKPPRITAAMLLGNLTDIILSYDSDLSSADGTTYTTSLFSVAGVTPTTATKIGTRQIRLVFGSARAVGQTLTYAGDETFVGAIMPSSATVNLPVTIHGVSSVVQPAAPLTINVTALVGDFLTFDQLRGNDGSAVTSGATVSIRKDGATSAAAGLLTHVAGGIWEYLPAPGEIDTNGETIFILSHASHTARVLQRVLPDELSPFITSELNRIRDEIDAIVDTYTDPTFQLVQTISGYLPTRLTAIDNALDAQEADLDNLTGIVGLIQARTDLIGSASAAIVAIVSPTGEIASPLIIGDDYLAANDRAFQWTVPAITGVTVGTATAYFGGKMINGTDNWLVSGTVADIGSGQWRISVDLPKTATADLQPGRYRWSCEIRSASGTEITRVRNAGDNKTVMLVNKQT